MKSVHSIKRHNHEKKNVVHYSLSRVLISDQPITARNACESDYWRLSIILKCKHCSHLCNRNSPVPLNWIQNLVIRLPFSSVSFYWSSLNVPPLLPPPPPPPPLLPFHQWNIELCPESSLWHRPSISLHFIKHSEPSVLTQLKGLIKSIFRESLPVPTENPPPFWYI